MCRWYSPFRPHRFLQARDIKLILETPFVPSVVGNADQRGIFPADRARLLLRAITANSGTQSPERETRNLY